jgi:RNA polymerase sigma-70 factor (ECF subfamily)
VTHSTATLIKALGRHRGLLLAYARNHGVSPDDCEDVAQQTIMRAWRHIDQFHSEDLDAEMRAWLVTIARHCIYDMWRRGAARRKYENLRTADPITVCRGEDSWEVERIIAAIDRLSDAQRAAITGYLLGSEYRQIADELGVPVGTVKSRIFRVREALQAC